MAQLFTNNATSTLAAGISSSDVSLTVATGHGARFPTITGADYFLVTLEKPDGTREIIKVTARSGDVLSGITRAQEGTTAVAFLTGHTVELRVTAATIADAVVAPAQIYAGAMREIASITTSGSQTTVTFNAIPGTYRDLHFALIGRSTVAATNATVYVRFNGDTGSNYDWSRQNYAGFAGQGYAASRMELGSVNGSTAPASVSAPCEGSIRSYAGTTFKKSCSMRSGLHLAASSNNMFHEHGEGLWRNAAAITQIEFSLSSGAFEDGLQATLYGIGGEVGGASLNPIYTKYDPFCPPVNPSALDDEFNVDQSGAAPAGWTSVGVQTPATDIRLGTLQYITTPASGVSCAGFEKTMPATGIFTIATRITQLAVAAYSIGGIYVRSSATGRIFSGGGFINSALVADNYVTCEKFTSFTARSAVAFYQVGRSDNWIRVTSDGTDIRAQFSLDGIRWTDLFVESLATWFSGGTPDRCGLILRSEHASNVPKVQFDFFRYFPVANADIGRNIGVGSDGAIVDLASLAGDDPEALYDILNIGVL